MMELFRMEIETQIDKLSQGLLTLEQGDSDATVLENLMRAAHSIKGAARMVNVEAVVQVAHEIEECFVAMQSHLIYLDKKSVDSLLTSIDLISQIGRVHESQLADWQIVHQQDIIKNVSALRKIYEINAASAIDVQSSKLFKKKYSDEKKSDFRITDQASGETIRITVDRLDRILNLAGKSLVQTHELSSVMPDMWQIKHKQQRIISHLNRLQEQISENVSNETLKEKVKLILSDANSMRHHYADGIARLDTIDRRSSTIADYLHREILASRMRPISEIFNGLPRMVRDLSRRLKKDVRLQITGEDTLVDRNVLERIDTPIKHLVQNAIDHGIEHPLERVAAGKSRLAQLTIDVSMSAGMLFIVLNDDGRGLDMARLRQLIFKKGLASKAELASLKQKELLKYLFYPGFSMRENVNEISGRGVGLDLVHDAVMSLNGSVEAESVINTGMRFQLILPVTISVMRVLLTTIAGESYAFPLSGVRGVHVIKPERMTKVDTRYYVNIDNQTYVLMHSNKIFACRLPKVMPQELNILLISDDKNNCAIVVEKTHGEQELSIQNLSADLGKIRGVSSAAILNSGGLTLIIDVEDYIDLVGSLLNNGAPLRLCQEEVVAVCEVLNVLVVDDSMTVREMERKILLKNHYRVTVAEDGVDALVKLQQNMFDILVTDIDMPNMDGLRLINEIRNLSEYCDIPILMVTNREKSFIKQSVIVNEKTVYYAKDNFSPKGFLTNVKLLAKLVVSPVAASS